MPILKIRPKNYIEIFPNYICCLCFGDLEESTLVIDDLGDKWDVCINCKDKVKW